MNNYSSRPIILISTVLALTACTTAKLEARLEANPQCKDVINPKTGALMPCPGSDKAFYAAAGLAPAKPAPVAATSTSPLPAPTSSATSEAIVMHFGSKPGNVIGIRDLKKRAS
jgi:hypothetical protein